MKTPETKRMPPRKLPVKPPLWTIDSEKVLDTLLEDLRAWVKQEHGRSQEIALGLDIPKQRVSEWLRGERRPNGGHALVLRALIDGTLPSVNPETK